MAYNTEKDIGALEKTAPGMLNAIQQWTRPKTSMRSPVEEARGYPFTTAERIKQEEDDRLASFAPQPGAKEPETIFSNYMTGPGYTLPKGMAMMGDEPRQETAEEYLVKNGARDIVGKDPYLSAWEKTISNWDGWFDVLGGDKTPFNPNFRKVYGKKFDEELKENQASALADRNKGMESVTKMLEDWRLKNGDHAVPGQSDVLQAMNVKGLPGAPDPRDYQGGVKDATGQEQEKAAKAEDRRLYREGLAQSKADKEQAAKEKALISTHTAKVTATYTAMKADAQRKLRDYGAKLKAAQKRIDNGEEGWSDYADSYKGSIQNMTDFLDNMQTYKDLDIDAISRLQAPPNIQKVQNYWKKGIIKYRQGGEAAAGPVDEE